MIANLAEYTGPVVNVEPPGRRVPAFTMFCGDCMRASQLRGTTESDAVPMVNMRDIAHWGYGETWQRLLIWMGRCSTCGTVYQTWYYVETQQEAQR